MEEYNFLPMWYRKKLDKKARNKLNLCYVILSILILFCITRYFINISYINNLNKIIEENTYRKTESDKKSALRFKDKYETIDIFNNFRSAAYSNFNIDNIYVNDKEILLESAMSNISSLTKFVKTLEEKKIYKIKSLNLENTESNSIRFKISLEVKNNDKTEQYTK